VRNLNQYKRQTTRSDQCDRREPAIVSQVRSNAGIPTALYEDAVMAYPPGDQTVGRAAIQALWEQVLEHARHFEPEDPLPTPISGDIELTATAARDGAGARAQVLRRQPDGSWLRLLDQPEFSPPPA
jgi:ketosteroid isomerase-like protein